MKRKKVRQINHIRATLLKVAIFIFLPGFALPIALFFTGILLMIIGGFFCITIIGIIIGLILIFLGGWFVMIAWKYFFWLFLTGIVIGFGSQLLFSKFMKTILVTLRSPRKKPIKK